MQVNWLADVLSPMQNPSLKVKLVKCRKKHTEKRRLTRNEMDQFYLYIKPFLSTGETDLQIHKFLESNNKLTNPDGTVICFSSVAWRIHRARKLFNIPPNSVGPRIKVKDE